MFCFGINSADFFLLLNNIMIEEDLLKIINIEINKDFKCKCSEKLSKALNIYAKALESVEPTLQTDLNIFVLLIGSLTRLMTMTMINEGKISVEEYLNSKCEKIDHRIILKIVETANEMYRFKIHGIEQIYDCFKRFCPSIVALSSNKTVFELPDELATCTISQNNIDEIYRRITVEDSILLCVLYYIYSSFGGVSSHKPYKREDMQLLIQEYSDNDVVKMAMLTFHFESFVSLDYMCFNHLFIYLLIGRISVDRVPKVFLKSRNEIIQLIALTWDRKAAISMTRRRVLAGVSSIVYIRNIVDLMLSLDKFKTDIGLLNNFTDPSILQHLDLGNENHRLLYAILSREIVLTNVVDRINYANILKIDSDNIDTYRDGVIGILGSCLAQIRFVYESLTKGDEFNVTLFNVGISPVGFPPSSPILPLKNARDLSSSLPSVICVSILSHLSKILPSDFLAGLPELAPLRFCQFLSSYVRGNFQYAFSEEVSKEFGDQCIITLIDKFPHMISQFLSVVKSYPLFDNIGQQVVDKITKVVLKSNREDIRCFLNTFSSYTSSISALEVDELVSLLTFLVDSKEKSLLIKINTNKSPEIARKAMRVFGSRIFDRGDIIKNVIPNCDFLEDFVNGIPDSNERLDTSFFEIMSNLLSKQYNSIPVFRSIFRKNDNIVKSRWVEDCDDFSSESLSASVIYSQDIEYVQCTEVDLDRVFCCRTCDVNLCACCSKYCHKDHDIVFVSSITKNVRCKCDSKCICKGSTPLTTENKKPTQILSPKSLLKVLNILSKSVPSFKIPKTQTEYNSTKVSCAKLDDSFPFVLKPVYKFPQILNISGIKELFSKCSIASDFEYSENRLFCYAQGKKFLVSACADKVRVHSLDTLEVLSTVDISVPILYIDSSPNHDKLIVALSYFKCYLFCVDGGGHIEKQTEIIVEDHPDTIHIIKAFILPGEKYLCVVTTMFIKVYDYKTDSIAPLKFHQDRRITSAAIFERNGAVYLVIARNGGLTVFLLVDNQGVALLEEVCTHNPEMRSITLSYSPEFDMLFASSGQRILFIRTESLLFKGKQGENYIELSSSALTSMSFVMKYPGEPYGIFRSTLTGCIYCANFSDNITVSKLTASDEHQHSFSKGTAYTYGVVQLNGKVYCVTKRGYLAEIVRNTYPNYSFEKFMKSNQNLISMQTSVSGECFPFRFWNLVEEEISDVSILIGGTDKSSLLVTSSETEIGTVTDIILRCLCKSKVIAAVEIVLSPGQFEFRLDDKRAIESNNVVYILPDQMGIKKDHKITVISETNAKLLSLKVFTLPHSIIGREIEDSCSWYESSLTSFYLEEQPTTIEENVALQACFLIQNNQEIDQETLEKLFILSHESYLGRIIRTAIFRANPEKAEEIWVKALSKSSKIDSELFWRDINSLKVGLGRELLTLRPDLFSASPLSDVILPFIK